MFGLPSFVLPLVGALLLSGASFGGGFYLERQLKDGQIAQIRLDATNKQKAIDDKIMAAMKASDASALQAAVAEAQAQQKIVTKYVTIIKEIPAHVAPTSACTTPTWGLIRVLDAAALGTDAGSTAVAPGQSDDTCSNLPWDKVAEDLADDYAAAHANAEQLNALEGSITAIHSSTTIRTSAEGP